MQRLFGFINRNVPFVAIIVILTVTMITLASCASANQLNPTATPAAVPTTAPTTGATAAPSAALTAAPPELSTSTAEIHTAETLQLSIKNYGGDISWISSDPYVATVDSHGVVTGKHKAGVTGITAKAGDTVLTCEVTNDTVMQVISAKDLVSKIKIGSNFGSALDYIDFSYKTGYDDYNSHTSDIYIAFTLYEPNTDHSFFNQGVSMRKGDSVHQAIPLNNLDTGDSSLKLSKAVIQTFYRGNTDGKLTVEVSNAKITVGKTVYNLDYLNGTHSIVTYAGKDPATGIYNCGNSVGDDSDSGLPEFSKLKGGMFEADVKIVDISEPGRVDKETYYMTNEGMCGLPTKEMVDALKKSGYDAIRLTVSWTPHMNDSTFVIDGAWLNKVEELANWILDDDMFCIINSHCDYNGTSWVGDHWDAAWMLPKYQEYVDARYTAMWKQIAEKFKDYDDYLLFENMNEPHMTYDAFTAEGGKPENYDSVMADRVNTMNGIFYSAMQSSGGNNAKRCLMLACPMETTGYLKYLKIPASDKIIATVHTYYTPDEHGSYDDGNGNRVTFEKAVGSDMEQVEAFMKKTGVPMLLGEFGNTEAVENQERIYQATFLVEKAAELGVPCFWWESVNLSWDDPSGRGGLYDRAGMKWAHKDILQAIISAAKKK